MSSTASRPPHREPMLIALVAGGGALGALARYAISQTWSAHGSLPWPILFINAIGALILGALLEALTRRGGDSGGRRRLRLFLGTGFCGAFTTYSTFAHDVVILGHDHAGRAVGWGLAEVLVGLGCAALGAWLGAAVSLAGSRSELS